MLSRLEDAILRSKAGSGGFRDVLFDELDGATLRNLRLVSRLLRGPVDDQSEGMFGQLFVRTPLPCPDETCKQDDKTRKKHLIQTRAHSTNSHEVSRRGVDFVQSVRQKLNLERQPVHRNRSGSLGSSYASGHSTSPTQMTHSEGEDQKDRRRIWTDLLSRFNQLHSLTFRVQGNPAWPGRTKIEDTLVDLRIAIERAALPKLRHFCLSPIHAMGIMHLIWSGPGVFGEAQATRGDVWHRIEFLDIHIVNPFSNGQLSSAQQLMFTKTLFDYLKSFASTVRILRFLWLGEPGPSPLALHLESGLAQRLPTRWKALEELWIGNILLPKRTITLVHELAPAIKQVKHLHSVHRDSYLEVDDPSAWLDLAFGHNSEAARDGASSIYSQSAGSDSARTGGISMTSKSIRIMLDL